MDKEGYPEESELELIQNWDTHDVMNLIDYIEERWWMPDWGFKKGYYTKMQDPIDMDSETFVTRNSVFLTFLKEKEKCPE